MTKKQVVYLPRGIYSMHIMKKIRTTITIDRDLLRRGKKNRISISSFLNIELRKYLAIIEGKLKKQQEVFDESFFEKDTLRRRFELPLPLRRTGSQGRRVRPNFATSA
jgi:hypothetical protein